MTTKEATEAPRVAARLHHYRLDLGQSNEAKEWDELRAQLNESGARCLESWGGGQSYSQRKTAGFVHPHGTVEDIELDTGHCFDNQWNEADREEGRNGRRLFDWYLVAVGSPDCPNRNIRTGHYLELSPEAIEARACRYTCGYCGKQYHGASAVEVPSFCGACLDSPYLKETELYLLRIAPVSGGIHGGKREPLTEAEAAEIGPRYVEAQTVGKKSRAVAARERKRVDVVNEATQALADAVAKRDGFLWLLDRCLNVENCIYYGHKTQNGDRGVFCFGWRRDLTSKERSAWLGLLSEFPFQYELKGGEES